MAAKKTSKKTESKEQTTTTKPVETTAENEAEATENAAAADTEQNIDTAELKEATAENPLEGIPADVVENAAAAAESDDGFERVIYIGVTIENLGLTQNTIYTLNPSTMPLISAAKKAYPIINRLLIPIGEYTPMHKHTHRAYYNKLAAAVGAPLI